MSKTLYWRTYWELWFPWFDYLNQNQQMPRWILRRFAKELLKLCWVTKKSKIKSQKSKLVPQRTFVAWNKDALCFTASSLSINLSLTWAWYPQLELRFFTFLNAWLLTNFAVRGKPPHRKERAFNFWLLTRWVFWQDICRILSLTSQQASTLHAYFS